MKIRRSSALHSSTKPGAKKGTEPGGPAARIFTANERMNQLLIEHLDAKVWNAKPPGKVRTIAAMFTHMHNVRCKWVRLTAPYLKVPSQLKRSDCTPRQARIGLAESGARCVEMLADAFRGDGRVREFRRDGWARPWPVGMEMLCTWWRMKRTIAGRYACSRISWEIRCQKKWGTDCGIGKS